MNTLPQTMIMTPEYKRWLKSPRREHLDRLANEHGFTVHTYYSEGSADNFVMLYKDGVNIKKKDQNIFHFTEAIKIIKERF